jgi:hypothetical protein
MSAAQCYGVAIYNAIGTVQIWLTWARSSDTCDAFTKAVEAVHVYDVANGIVFAIIAEWLHAEFHGRAHDIDCDDASVACPRFMPRPTTLIPIGEVIAAPLLAVTVRGAELPGVSVKVLGLRMRPLCVFAGDASVLVALEVDFTATPLPGFGAVVALGAPAAASVV